MTETTLSLGARAKRASTLAALLSGDEKKEILHHMAALLRQKTGEILAANAEDLQAAKAQNMPLSMQDRLLLTEERIAQMAGGLDQIAEEKEPIGEIMEDFQRPNGLHIRKVRVPMGVIGVIYEARPNVTTDVAGLCLKAGNAVLLRGGKEAYHSNNCLTGILQKALTDCKKNPDMVLLVQDLTRQSSFDMMHMTDYLDLLIPRGGAGLIAACVQESRVPVIQTGVGNCHVYVDKSADVQMALSILLNAKTQRPSVCNACESLLVHEEIAPRFLPMALSALKGCGVTVHGCPRTALYGEVLPAEEADYAREYLGMELSCKVVSSLDEAISHIRSVGTHHSETIVTSDREAGERFQREVDASCVYVNASTRFTDGGEFGFGGEIGISTQKLHARGPMGILALTSYQYRIDGTGQTR